MKRLEVRLSGFGGQGIIRSGEIVGKAAALYDGRFATFTQSYGPESRGGACAAQVAIADDPLELSYPHVLDPSVLIVMSQGGYNKYAPDFRRDGLLITDEDLVDLDQAAEGLRVLSIPATRMAEELGRRIVANVVMLGFVAAVTDIATPEAVKRAVLDSVPKGTEELNERAFDAGFEYGQGVGSVAVAVSAGVEETPATEAAEAEQPVERKPKPKKTKKKSAKGKKSK